MSYTLAHFNGEPVVRGKCVIIVASFLRLRLSVENVENASKKRCAEDLPYETVRGTISGHTNKKGRAIMRIERISRSFLEFSIFSHELPEGITLDHLAHFAPIAEPVWEYVISRVQEEPTLRVQPFYRNFQSDKFFVIVKEMYEDNDATFQMIFDGPYQRRRSVEENMRLFPEGEARIIPPMAHKYTRVETPAADQPPESLWRHKMDDLTELDFAIEQILDRAGKDQEPGKQLQRTSTKKGKRPEKSTSIRTRDTFLFENMENLLAAARVLDPRKMSGVDIFRSDVPGYDYRAVMPKKTKNGESVAWVLYEYAHLDNTVPETKIAFWQEHGGCVFPWRRLARFAKMC